ncbi:flagellar hook-length control protein FliK [Roseicyclus mahoneyensis]|uniref:flagellar hook-length control protein FliK n=1 Tax=Roseicyclus mahoneyensis TaxID=164332 RepID=UPI001475385E|nr:flagellar hook-length control protein FliK [Roseicyclus mahoneyensis]
MAVDAGPTVDMAFGTSAAGMPDRGGPVPDPAPIARQVARAVVDASRDPGVPLDLTLDPPELGRLRLGFSDVNGVLTVTIAAERSDTADLIRRHVALLAEEFARAGLDAPSVSISHGGAEQRSRGGSVTLAGSGTEAASSPDAPAPSARARPMGAAGLDLRL